MLLLQPGIRQDFHNPGVYPPSGTALLLPSCPAGLGLCVLQMSRSLPSAAPFSHVLVKGEVIRALVVVMGEGSATPCARGPPEQV